jgi:outer membrane protein TolC
MMQRSIALVVALSTQLVAQDRQARNTSEPTAEARVLSLERCLELAEFSYPSIAEAEARLRHVRAQLSEARTAPYSDFSTTAGLALAPTLRGTQIFSRDTDVSLSDNMGLAWQVNVSGTLPLWTFGKIASVVDAANANVRIKEHEVRQTKNELRQSVRHAYFGVLFARDALNLLRDAEKRIDKHLVRLEKAVEAQDADEVSLYKMKMYRAELAARGSEARREEAVALSGLRTLVGGSGNWDVVDAPMPAPAHQLAPLAHYLSAARIHRPEVNMARAGVLAREAQLRLESAQYYPSVGVTLSAGWSQAPEITDQLNPFVHDPGNYLRYGAALGLRWKLDFLPQSARHEAAEAKLEEMRATERYALGGVGAEVEKAFYEARAGAERLRLYGAATEWARRWMITVQQGIDIGTYDDEDIVQPAKEYALKRFAEMSATFDYHMALARLALATGWDSVSRVE